MLYSQWPSSSPIYMRKPACAVFICFALCIISVIIIVIIIFRSSRESAEAGVCFYRLSPGPKNDNNRTTKFMMLQSA